MGVNRDSRAADAIDGDAIDGSERAFVASGDVPPGSLASLDSTLPPTPLRDLLAADGATIFVLSADRELMRTVRQAGGNQYPIDTAADWSELVDAAAARRASIVLLDADCLPLALPEAVETLHDTDPAIVVLVAAKRDAAQEVMSLLAERKVHRLLIKPATDGITRLLLESAIGRFLQRRDQQALSAVLVDNLGPPRRYRQARTSWSAWVLATALVTATVGAVVVGEIYGVRWRESIDRAIDRIVADDSAVGSRRAGQPSEPSSDAPSIRTGPPAAATSTARAVEAPLDATAPVDTATPADAAAPADRPTPAEPARAVGVDGERVVVSAARPNPARAADDASAPATNDAPATATDDASAPATDDAPATATDDASAPATNDAPATATDDESATATDDAPAAAPDDAPAAAPDESASRTTDLDVLLDLIDARLEDGRLLAPDGDGATAYFEQALALSSFDPRLLTRRDAIAAALVDAADVALARGDLDEAQRLAAEAFRLGAERLELARLDREIETVQGARILERHRQLLSAATAAMQEGRLLGAVGEGALASLAALRRERSTLPELSEAWQEVSQAVAANVHAAIGARDFAAAQRWAAALAVEGGDARRASDLEFEARQAEFLATPVASADLQVIEAPAPVYPIDARAAGVEGWVDLDFVVDREGRPRNITIIDSRPGRRFIDAAVDAVARHRYVPFLLDRRVYERRVQLRVRFELR